MRPRRLRRVALVLAAILAGGALLFFLIGPGIVERRMNRVAGEARWPVSARAATLHRGLAVVDLHADTLLWKRDPARRAEYGHVDLPRLRQGNVALQVFASVTKTPRGQNYDSNSAETDNITLLSVAQLQPPRTWSSLLHRSLHHAAKLERAEAAGGLMIVRSRADLARLLRMRAGGSAIVGGLLAVEGLHNLEGRRDNLDRLFQAGYRMAGLAHFFDNELAGSVHGERKHGLTPLGRQVMAEMERRGMIVDVAHASEATVADVVALATRPVVSSHGGVRGTCNRRRNLSDAQIRAIARTGGIIGIGFWAEAVCEATPAATARAIRYVRDLVGIEHVALGSDFDGAVETGFDASQLAAVTQALMDEGLADREIALVMGGNALRFLGATLPDR